MSVHEIEELPRFTMADRLRPLLKAAWLTGLLAGCGEADSRHQPRLAAHTSPQRVLSLAAAIPHLEALAREPMVVEHPDGTLFVAGYGSQVTGTDPHATPALWRSADNAMSWTKVDVGTAEEGAIGNSDVDLAVAPDGTLYFVSMGFDRSRLAGTHIAIGVSHDVGLSWQWTLLSETPFDDRPWVEVAPDGTAHVIWNDGNGISHAVSSDRGTSWEEREKVHPRGGSSHLAIGPQGVIAVRITPLSASGNRYDEGLDLVAVSTDGGNRWQTRSAPGQRTWSSDFGDPNNLPRWVEPLAWDETGALYSLWSEGSEVWLARSTDRGESWESWTIATTEPAGAIAYFPYLVAKGSGQLAATWFRRHGEALDAHAALVTIEPAGGLAAVLRSAPLTLDSWTDTENGRSLDPAGEYLPVAFLASGDLAVVSPIQNARDGRFGFTWWRFTAP